MSDSNFPAIFARLKAILQKYEPELVVNQDGATGYSLNTHHIMKNKQPMFFGAVQVNKNYVSYHLMPLYASPQLLAAVSPELKKRMQGKSCFNFKQVDDNLFEELAELTQRGFEGYRQRDLLGSKN